MLMRKQGLDRRNRFRSLLFVSLFVIPLFHWSMVNAEDTDWNQINSSDWMEHIDGEKEISEITIPGSHDSATQYIPFSYFAQCQDESIADQLESGVRFLDIRLKSKESDDEVSLKLSHGFLSCKTSSSLFSSDLTFKKVLEQCYDFLDNHQNETIIMAIKHEYGSQEISQVQNAIYKLIDDKKDTYWYLKNNNPKLEEVRGKIVLARRFDDENEYGDENGGLNFQWIDQGGTDIGESSFVENEVKEGIKLLVQDHYEYGEEDKWEAVKDGLEQSEAITKDTLEDEFFLNYLSTKGDNIFGHPRKYADTLNEKLLEYDLKNGCDYGILVMDFVTEELVRKVYESNQFVNY